MTFTKEHPGPKYVPVPISKEQDEKIRRMWNSTGDYNSLSHIAMAVGVSENRLRAYVKEIGLPKRIRPLDRA